MATSCPLCSKSSCPGKNGGASACTNQSRYCQKCKSNHSKKDGCATASTGGGNVCGIEHNGRTCKATISRVPGAMKRHKEKVHGIYR